jgi:7-keto-8-aminopelargonate synthetase-like enzyme
MSHPDADFAPAHMIATKTDRSIQGAVDADVAMLALDDVEYSGRYLPLRGKSLLNFGGCSYLALEQRPELREGAIRAIERYGTQLSFSRVYVESPLYQKLEEALGALTGGFALVVPSTTLAHIAALPVLIEAGDALLLDQYAHASLHTATAVLRAIHIEPVRHNRIDLVEEAVVRLGKTHRHVWYVLDGLYSMMGDFAKLSEVSALLERHPQLHLYVDDAHSTSWTGQNGRGYGLTHLPDRSRVVVALSLNKAFSAGGAALIFPTDAERLRVRRCGGPLLFSGPLQPPLLGAALASARLHLQPTFADLQKSLCDRIDLVQSLAKDLGIPLAAVDQTPIFFIRCGPPRTTFAVANRLREHGFYVCVSVFPAVPESRSGIRFTVSLNNTEADIRGLLGALSAELTKSGQAAAAEE